jgi:hypothetical protein
MNSSVSDVFVDSDGFGVNEFSCRGYHTHRLIHLELAYSASLNLSGMETGIYGLLYVCSFIVAIMSAFLLSVYHTVHRPRIER